MNAAKIRLSQKEKELVINADWILTKNQILQKVNALLGHIHSGQDAIIKANPLLLLPEVAATTPKISKGENYNGLPYLILDFPRLFDKQDIFAVRTMFWWGNFFSITLHLSGKYKTMAAETVAASYSLLSQKGYSICVHDEQWEHHFEKDNYKAIAEMEKDDFILLVRSSSFIKLAKNIPLEQWDEAENKLTVYFSELLQVAGDQLPRR